MLQVEVDASWRVLEPPEVVDHILHRRLARDTPARDDAHNGQRPLERMLSPEHYRQFSHRLLREVHAIYLPDRLQGLGLLHLEERVAELLQWDLPLPQSRQVHLRLTWLAAFLAELLGRDEQAIQRYEEFLALRPEKEERQLALLARNNRAALQLRAGKLLALRDLVRIAVVDFLPGACFGLVNILNLARTQGWLDRIDPLVTEVLSKLAEPLRKYWLGPDPPGPRFLESDSPALSRFLGELVRHAAAIKPDVDEKVTHELRLWVVPHNLLVAGERPAGGTPVQERHRDYAEAVTLLYPCEIAEVLRKVAPLPTVHEVLARKQIVQARSCLERGELDSARDLLNTAGGLLKANEPSSRRGERLGKTIKRMLKVVDARQRHVDALTFQRELTELTEQVDRVCQMDSLPEAAHHRMLLTNAIKRVQELQGTVGTNSQVDVTLPLCRRLQAHRDELERQALLTRLSKPYERLRELLPVDVNQPAAPEAYELLQLCRAADPQGKVQNWKDIHKALDQHTARHHFHRAYQHACDRPNRDRQEIETELTQALSLESGLVPFAAPLIALLCLPQAQDDLNTFEEVRGHLKTQADRLIQEELLGGGSLIRPELRREVLAEAIRCLHRIMDVLLSGPSDEEAVKQMTQRLWEILKPSVHRGQPADVEAVVQMLNEWQAVCSPDPRHPIRAAQRYASVSHLLAQGRACVTSNPPRAKEFAIQAFDRCLCDHAQAVTAVSLYALARPLDGPESRHGRILDALEERARSLSEDAVGELTAAIVERWIEEIKHQSGH